MSHIATLRAEVRDPRVVAAACRRLGLPEPVAGSVRLYRTEAAGLLVHLPGWAYPLVLDTAEGRIRFDHFGGAWGDPAHLDRFLQAYAVEAVGQEARRRGHTVVERALADGSIRLSVRLGGGDA